ncbi:MAG: hypothetical protein WAM66_13710 [Acidobacteriaceae bacterium]
MSKPTRLEALSRLIIVKAKVERAKQNLLDMEAALNRYYGYRIGANKHRKTAPLGMIDTYNLPMEALTAAGDVVGNLWGALDHLCYQLIDSYSRTATPEILEQSAFPFAKDIAGYAEVKSRRHVELMDPGAVEVLDSLKPYRGGNEHLTFLYDLNNFSKHRMLVTVGKFAHLHAEWIGKYSIGTGFLLINAEPYFSGIYDPSEVHKDAYLPHEEAIAKFDVAGRNAMLPTLHYLVNVIDGILDRFLPFLGSH